MWTEAKQKAATREMTVRYGSKWIGRMVTDCSGLLRWALKQLGENIVHHARYQYTDYSSPKGKLHDGRREDGTLPLPGTAVFLQGKESKIHHVGVYIGGDTVIEAKGTIYGVTTSHLAHWDHWGELKMVDYTNAAALEPAAPEPDTDDAEPGTVIRAVVTNPNRWLNVRSGPGTEYPVVFQIEKGQTVEVLDAGEPAWWQIRFEGQIGWASAQFLTPIPGDSPDSEEKLPDHEENLPEQAGDIRAELVAIRDMASALLDRTMDLIALIDGRAED